MHFEFEGEPIEETLDGIDFYHHYGHFQVSGKTVHEVVTTLKGYALSVVFSGSSKKPWRRPQNQSPTFGDCRRIRRSCKHLLACSKAPGFENVQISVAQPAGLDGEVKLMSALTIENIADAVMAEGLAARAEIDRIADELYTYARTPGTIGRMPRVVEAWASGRQPNYSQPGDLPAKHDVNPSFLLPGWFPIAQLILHWHARFLLTLYM